ncbi:hypothetical protein DOTSEDRAFT_71253 [Dothistroma septosporum NZE10]|uniref:Velvet domain-containing protein n=1 Tax=Dothistroma septosporum (strain NZE10 / CBS 128990) TaxID=675120 RepID=N1PQ04_DOTSN|nr:hypothetical protein DOTSEDRAFT_71253 [Dothistroma septosporum NZE10]
MMARDQVQLIVRQQPTRAQVVQENNPKNRKPIDPPPIIELKYDDRNDPSNSQWLVSPRTFMMVTLVDDKDSKHETRNESPGKLLIGQTVSSLHRLKDVTNKDGGFFVFGDISARRLGSFRLRFSLFDTIKESDEVLFMGSIESDPFPVLAQRDFGSMSESTHLTRTFSDQGVKLRVRKDTRAISSIGTKRSFNASPPDTTSPGLHSTMYGGAVQDHYSAGSPAVKRQRAGSEYDSSHLYGIPGGDSHLSHYASSIPSATRAWTGGDTQRVPVAYGQQQSPMSMGMSSRMQQPMGVQAHTPPSWSNINSQSALPSPTPSVSTQQPPSYPSTTTQHQSSSIFGDPGSASSIPRNPYYNNSYQPYQTHSQYQGHHSGDIQSAYELQMPGSTISDTAGLAAVHTPGYGHGYLQSSSIYPPEPSEVSGAYPYGLDEKYQNP